MYAQGEVRNDVSTYFKGAGACVIAAAIFSSFGPAQAGIEMNGYVEQKGHGDVAVSYTRESYDKFWVGDTPVTVKMATGHSGDVVTTSWALWADYGLSDNVTIIANLPYIKADGSDTFGLEVEGNQDLSALLKWRFASVQSGDWRHDFVVSGGMSNPASNYEVNTQPVNIGDGVSSWDLRFVYQLNYSAFYASQQVGYDLRSGDAPNQVALYTEVGATTGPVTFNVSFLDINSRGGSDIGDPGFTFSNNEKDFRRVGAKVYARASDNFGFFGAFFTTIGTGRNVGDATGWSGGLNIRY